LIFLELELPLVLKLLPVQQSFPKESNSTVEHIAVSSFFEGFIDFSHLPLEAFFIEILDILGNEFSEDAGDGPNLFFIVLEIELEGTESDATVVEGGH